MQTVGRAADCAIVILLRAYANALVSIYIPIVTAIPASLGATVDVLRCMKRSGCRRCDRLMHDSTMAHAAGFIVSPIDERLTSLDLTFRTARDAQGSGQVE